jgi:DUF2945 family protein
LEPKGRGSSPQAFGRNKSPRCGSHKGDADIYATLDGTSEKQVHKKPFKVADHVSWNSEAGRVSGRIVKVHKKDVNYKGYIHHASPDDPQYEIKSDKTDHIALHKASALKHLA